MSDRIIHTESGQVFREDYIRSLPSIGEGAYGKVYKLEEDKVIKLLNYPVYYGNDAMRYLKGLDLPNFYHIYDLLNEVGPNNIVGYSGVISSYYESEDVDIWTMPSSWIIENYERLCESVIKLGEKNIEIYDVCPHNAIINRGGITIIDADSYKIRDYSCVDKNLRYLKILLFQELLCGNYRWHYGIPNAELPLGSILSEFFFTDKSGKYKKDFVKTLSRYPKPMDYLNERLNK